MNRLPLLPTLLVGLAVAAMVALGIWQLQRHQEKTAALVQYRANISRPATAYPALRPTDGSYLFRTLSANCLRVTGWQSLGGRLPDGRPGWRQIANCASGAEGPGFPVELGISNDMTRHPAWRGGLVRGRATWEPQASNALIRWFTHSAPPRLMIVAASPPPGLAPATPPDPAGVPNNHLGYAVQWFLFAAVAVIIYALALRRRNRGAGGAKGGGA